MFRDIIQNVNYCESEGGKNCLSFERVALRIPGNHKKIEISKLLMKIKRKEFFKTYFAKRKLLRVCWGQRKLIFRKDGPCGLEIPPPPNKIQIIKSN